MRAPDGIRGGADPGARGERRSPVWALVPLKSLQDAKSRLAPVLTPEQRRLLAMAMFEDVLGELAGSRLVHGVTVLTDDDCVAACAKAFGCGVHEEDPGLGYVGSLARVAYRLELAGVATLVYVPADLPYVSRCEVDQLLARHRGGVTVCVAPEDDGTNALVCSPPTAILPSFGAPSRERHLSAARRNGFAAESLTLPGFARDIDRPSDLEGLRYVDRIGSRTKSVLKRMPASYRAQAETAGTDRAGIG